MILKDQIHLPHHHPKTKNIYYIRYIIGIFLLIYLCMWFFYCGGAYKHSLAYDHGNVTVEAYMASVIALMKPWVPRRRTG